MAIEQMIVMKIKKQKSQIISNKAETYKIFLEANQLENEITGSENSKLDKFCLKENYIELVKNIISILT